jgi:hypothetical protein
MDAIEFKHILAFLLNNRSINPFKGHDREDYTQYDVDHISHFYVDQQGYERLRFYQDFARKKWPLQGSLRAETQVANA